MLFIWKQGKSKEDVKQPDVVPRRQRIYYIFFHVYVCVHVCSSEPM